MRKRDPPTSLWATIEIETEYPAKTRNIETAVRLVRNNRMRICWVNTRKELEKYANY